jgi:hypothetical protein
LLYLFDLLGDDVVLALALELPPRFPVSFTVVLLLLPDSSVFPPSLVAVKLLSPDWSWEW